jgi:hypothetical protein
MYYVYLWLREDRTPYYVGKGKKYRAYQKHIIGCPPPKDRVIIVKEFEDENESYFFEEWLIQVYGRKCEGGILLNTSIGGQKSKSKYRTVSEYSKIRKEQNIRYKQSDKGKETQRKWDAANPEIKKESQRKFRERNREAINEKQRNNEKKKAADKNYKEKNKERIREQSRQYYQRKKLEKASSVCS